MVGMFETEDWDIIEGRSHFLFLGLSDCNLVLHELSGCSRKIRLQIMYRNVRKSLSPETMQ